MKSILDEVLFESTVLNERPYSRTQSAIDSAKGKVKSVFGSGQVEQGAASTGNYANTLWKQFKMYIGRVYGRSPDVVTYDDVAGFMKEQGLSVDLLGQNTNRRFDPREVGDILLQAARDGIQHRSAPTPAPAPAAAQGQPSPAPAGTPPAQNPPAGNSAGTPPVNNGAAGNSGNPAPASNNSGLQNTISGLSPQQRAALLQMII